ARDGNRHGQAQGDVQAHARDLRARGSGLYRAAPERDLHRQAQGYRVEGGPRLRRRLPCRQLRLAQDLMAEPLVALKGLTVDFDTGKRVVRALHGIDLEVAPGEAIGLVGESGCGKSVTWLAALGLLGKSARVGGQVLLADRNLVGAPVAELEHVRGRRIAMIFQDPSSSL